MDPSKSIVYLIPSFLHEEGIDAIPPYLTDAIKDCGIFFVENKRTARRYVKKIWREIVIDNYEWFLMGGAGVRSVFKQKIKEGKNIGIISEAGCPGVADPGQELVSAAHEIKAQVKPLVGPNSILLALMASGMNGQQFRFVGYLPINEHDRIKAIKDLESESGKKNCTQILIETPYRNNHVIESVLKTCKPDTRFCIAVDLTSPKEWVRTMSVGEWQKNKTNIHKHAAIFLIYAGI